MPNALNHTREVLMSPETLATMLLIVFVDKFGMEPLGGPRAIIGGSDSSVREPWDPTTVIMEVNRVFSVELPEGNFNKLMAAITLVTTDQFYESLPDFINLCNCLNDGTSIPGQWIPADVEAVAWGITEAIIIWPQANDKAIFCPDIVEYIKKVLECEGLVVPPDILRLESPPGEDPWTQVQSTYSDDPEMFAAIYGVQHSRTDEVNQNVKTRLKMLLDQLQNLRLQDGDAVTVVRKMLQGLKGIGKQDINKIYP